MACAREYLRSQNESAPGGHKAAIIGDQKQSSLPVKVQSVKKRWRGSSEEGLPPGLEAEWNNKLRALAEAQEQYEQQTQKQRLLIDSQTRQQLLSLADDFPRIWNDPGVEPRERKRILRLLIEDVTLINGEMNQVHVRLRGGATRTLTVAKPLPIAQLRKTKPEVVAEIDRLLDDYCDRGVAEILNQQERRTWQGEPFNLKKVAHIRKAYNLRSRHSRLRATGLLSAKEMSTRHGVSLTTISFWAREGRLKKYGYDNGRRCLYEPVDENAIRKGHGGRWAKQPVFTVAGEE